MTHSEWRDRWESAKARIEPWLERDDDGGVFISNTAPGPLVKIFCQLQEYGLEREWLRLDDEEGEAA